ncbi:MAG: hypothetical protein ACREOC_06450 [Gemmatimonadales bacterium]
MIALILLAVIGALLVATPWHRLRRAGRVWALAAFANLALFVSLPQTAATSPWRPLVASLAAACAATSAGLIAVGLLLRSRAGGQPRPGMWIGPLVAAAFPALFYSSCWLIGSRA